MKKHNGNGISFQDAKKLRDAVVSGKVQLIRPDQAEQQRQAIYFAEIREFWVKRGTWMRQLANDYAQRGEPLPDGETLGTLAEEYAVAEWKKQLTDVIDLCNYLEQPVPEQVVFCARLCGVEVDAKETAPKTLVPAS